MPPTPPAGTALVPTAADPAHASGCQPTETITSFLTNKRDGGAAERSPALETSGGFCPSGSDERRWAGIRVHHPPPPATPAGRFEALSSRCYTERSLIISFFFLFQCYYFQLKCNIKSLESTAIERSTVLREKKIPSAMLQLAVSL